jgi:hypothetical protein
MPLAPFHRESSISDDALRIDNFLNAVDTTIPKGRYTMLNLNSPQRFFTRFSVLALAAVFLMLSSLMLAQTTISTGTIDGTVTDPSGAVVSGAKIVVTNTGTGRTINLTSGGSGAFSSGPLEPGQYKVQVSAKGFSGISETVTVQVGNAATVNPKLQLGAENTLVEVQSSAVAVNTEQATVQGVLTSDQVANLPVNGRNFLDLAQLEPGAQIQDGQNFDPTKAGYSSISFGGRFGRTARIDVDGVDISDETVGTTTSDVPASAIDEFQVSQSSLDLSQDLTSSGAINVTTKSGTNTLHGEAFGFIRDHSFAANVPGGHDYPFQRDQFGGKVGGPVIKNKMFFFLDGERTKQDAFAAIDLSGSPFAGFGNGFSQPFRENNLLGKIDYSFGNGAKAFYRYSYFSNSLDATFGFGFSVYVNKDITRNHVVGLDFSTGSFTHSVRFSYLKFQNQIADATTGNNALPDCCLGVMMASGNWAAGPNLLAPQSTPQSDRQIKYDGTKIYHSHIIRYGVSLNHIQGGGFADFFGNAPRIVFTSSAANEAAAATGPFPGGAANPLNYPVTKLRVGNGQGFNTEQPALGFPAGGLGPDNRLGLYVGDSWKLRPNLTLNFGLRYDRDTGRTDSDLPANPVVNAAMPGLGDRVKQPNLNFAPQIGIAWDPKGNGKTVIRLGGGLFYENSIFNNVLFDRPLRLATGAFNQTPTVCVSGTEGAPANVVVNGQPSTISASVYDPVNNPSGICGNPFLGNVIPQIVAFQKQVQAGNPFSLTGANPNYINTFLANGEGIPIGWFDPNYKTPVSVQMNVGFQHEIRPGLVFSADYLRNVETRTGLGIDTNHVGDVRNFNQGAALSAITNTNAKFGCPAGAAGVQCAITAGAQMTDYAGFGLTDDIDFGQGCLGRLQDFQGNILPNTPCAFPGINPTQVAMTSFEPVGRSVYNALQMKLIHNVNSPFKGVKAMNYQVSYSLSNFSSVGGAQANGLPSDNDLDFVNFAVDNNKPGRNYGPALLDRTHQLSVGGYFDTLGGFRLGLIAHFYSPLSEGITANNSDIGAGEIFRTDYTGDGSVQDPLPGTHLGQFDRGTNAAGLANLISGFNAKYAGQATPAGQKLISSGLMTLTQLQSLNGVIQPIAAPVAGQADFTWLRAMDLKLSWHHTFKERYTVEPSIGFFNLANFVNYNLPPITMNGLLNSSGSINTTSKLPDPVTGIPGTGQYRIGNGTGVYSLGAPRQLEFGLRLVF